MSVPFAILYVAVLQALVVQSHLLGQTPCYWVQCQEPSWLQELRSLASCSCMIWLRSPSEWPPSPSPGLRSIGSASEAPSPPPSPPSVTPACSTAAESGGRGTGGAGGSVRGGDIGRLPGGLTLACSRSANAAWCFSYRRPASASWHAFLRSFTALLKEWGATSFFWSQAWVRAAAGLPAGQAPFGGARPGTTPVLDTLNGQTKGTRCLRSVGLESEAIYSSTLPIVARRGGVQREREHAE